MKQRGQWVDLSTLQGNLQEIKEIEDCQVVPDPGGSSTVHAFVVLKVAESLRVAEALRQVRKLLPHGQIHTLSSLPRHPVTCKVDYRKLTSLAKGSEESWPLNPSAAAEPFIIQRGKEKVPSDPCLEPSGPAWGVFPGIWPLFCGSSCHLDSVF